VRALTLAYCPSRCSRYTYAILPLGGSRDACVAVVSAGRRGLSALTCVVLAFFVACSSVLMSVRLGVITSQGGEEPSWVLYAVLVKKSHST